MAKLVRFVCWWCQELREGKAIHHQTRGVTDDGRMRRCCVPCYENPQSNYRRAYKDEYDERAQLRRLLREKREQEEREAREDQEHEQWHSGDDEA